MIKGLFETHIEVADLERSMKFYEEVLGLQFGIKEENRRTAAYWIGGWGKQMIGIWEKKPEEITSRHLAFEISPDDMDKAISFLKSNNLEYWNALRDGTKRPLVFGWMPAGRVAWSFVHVPIRSSPRLTISGLTSLVPTAMNSSQR